MHQAFLIVAVVLFALDFLLGAVPNPPWHGRLSPLAATFFAGAFLVG